MTLAAGLTRVLSLAGVPVVSVSIGDEHDHLSWGIQYAPEATSDHRIIGAAVLASFDASVSALPSATLRVWRENDSGQSVKVYETDAQGNLVLDASGNPIDTGYGHVDPSVEHVLVPEPPPGFVSLPQWAGIQCDSDRLIVTCHGLLNRTGNPVDPLIGVNWQDQQNVANRAILWAIKLTPAALVGGEYFLSVPVFPIPHGFNILASWSHCTPWGQVRTRCTTYEVPIEGFDWRSLVARAPGPFAQLTVS